MPETTERAVRWITVPAGTRSTTCRGTTCGMRIYFVRSPAGRIVPVDCDCPGGKRPSESKDVGQLDMLIGGDAQVFNGRGRSHFETCKDVDQFSRGAR
jgi:hypothetical protein